MRSIHLCAALLGLVPAFAQAQTACHALARTVSTLMPSAVADGRRSSPIEVLDQSSGGFLSIDRPAWPSGTGADTAARLRNEFKAPQDLLEAIEPMAPSRVFRFGRSSLYLAQAVEGTASCQRLVFFEARAGGPSRLLDAPAGMGIGEETAFCFGRQGHAGEIDGAPAFVVESQRQTSAEISVAPWRDGGWQKPCRVALSFDNGFEASERFCKGVDCEQMAEQARTLAKDVDESVGAGSGSVDMSRLTSRSGVDARIPTFGEKPVNADHDAYGSFQGDAIFVPLVVDGEMFVARIGRAGFAWRTSPNYLFAAYRMVGDHLEPVAGIYVDLVRSSLTDVRVD